MRIAILTILLVLSTSSWAGYRTYSGSYDYYNKDNYYSYDQYCENKDTTTHSVPEPETMMLFGLGLVAVGMLKRRKK